MFKGLLKIILGKVFNFLIVKEKNKKILTFWIIFLLLRIFNRKTVIDIE